MSERKRFKTVTKNIQIKQNFSQKLILGNIQQNIAINKVESFAYKYKIFRFSYPIVCYNVRRIVGVHPLHSLSEVFVQRSLSKVRIVFKNQESICFDESDY